MHKMVVFDDGLGQLAPLTDLRASFEIRTGVTTTLDRLRSMGDLVGLFVPPHLRELCRERHGTPVNDGTLFGNLKDPVLVVNGRCVLTDCIRSLQPGGVIVDQSTRHIVAAVVAPNVARELIEGKPAPTGFQTSAEHLLLSRPWHIRAFRDRAINADLARLIAQAQSTQRVITPPAGVLAFGGGPLIGGSTARIYPGAILDTELGPIFIDDHAVIRPGAIISGPAAVGAHSTVLERATIRPFTSIGPWC
jgi:hypothetical protein